MRSGFSTHSAPSLIQAAFEAPLCPPRFRQPLSFRVRRAVPFDQKRKIASDRLDQLRRPLHDGFRAETDEKSGVKRKVPPRPIALQIPGAVRAHVKARGKPQLPLAPLHAFAGQFRVHRQRLPFPGFARHAMNHLPPVAEVNVRLLLRPKRNVLLIRRRGGKPGIAADARRSPLRRYVPLLTSAKGRGGFLGYFFIHLGSNAAFAFLGKWLTVRFGLSVGQTGYVIIGLGLGNLLGSLLSGSFANRLGPVRTTAFALLFLTALYAALPHAPSAWAVGAAYLILFTALGILFPLVVAMLNALNASIRGTISSFATSTMNAATTVGAWIGGYLFAQAGGYGAIGLFSAACMLASLATLIYSGMLRSEAEPVPGSRREEAV